MARLIDAVIGGLGRRFPHFDGWPRDLDGRPTLLAEMDAYAAWPAVRLLAVDEGPATRRLAEAFADAVVDCPGMSTTADMDVVRWLIANAPQRVASHLAANYGTADVMRRRGADVLHRTIFMLPGPVGAAWFPLVARGWSECGWAYWQLSMGALQRWPEGWGWAEDDWALKIEALARARLEPRPNCLNVFRSESPAERPPPASSAPAQVHLGCVYGTGDADVLIRGIVKNLRAYLTGDPAEDVERYWWTPEDDPQAERLRDLLEIPSPPGYRRRLVDEALAQGFIDPTLAAKLGDPRAPRGAWADGPVPWTIEGVIHVGTLRLPEGRIGIVDADDDGDPIEYAQAGPVPTTGSVTVITATHPFVDEPWNAAVDVTLIADATITAWEVLRPGRPDEDGRLTPYHGRVGVGAPATFDALSLDGDRIDDILVGPPMLRDYGDAGSALAVAALGGPCTAYLGRDDGRRVVRLVVDLGLLGIDPTVEPALPWDPPPEGRR